MPDPAAELAARINAIRQSLSDASAAFAQAAGNLSSAAASMVGDLTTARGVLKSSMDFTESALKVVGINTINFAGDLTLLALRTTSLASNVYGADKAFSSLTTVLESMGQGLSNFANFAKQMPGISGAGKALAGSVALTSITFNKLSNVLKFQIDSAQKVADTFIQLSTMGASFNYSIGEMQLRAREVGVPLQMMAKIVQANSEGLSRLGLSMEEATLTVSSISADIFQDSRRAQSPFNRALAVSYGSLENLSKGVTDYLSLQTQLGHNIRSTSYMERIRNGEIQEYLMRQKELTALTGKSADALKKEEEERRKNFTYSQALNRMSPEQQSNTRTFMTMIKQMSPALHDAMMEQIGLGDILTESGQKFSAMNAPLVEFAKRGLAMTNQTIKGFQTSFGDLAEESAPQLKAFYEKNVDLAQIAMLSKNDMLQGFATAATGVTEFFSKLANMPAIMREAQLAQSKAAAVRMDPATESFLNASRSLINNQIEIDAIITSNMTKMSGLVNALNDMQMRMIRLQGRLSTTLLDVIQNVPDMDPQQIMTKLMETAAKSMRDMLDPNQPILPNTQAPELTEAEFQRRIAALNTENARIRAELERLRQQPPAPVVTPEAGVNPTRYATGGITTGPTVAGESGTEAVIPLEGGPVPIKIDWSPLVSAISEQLNLGTEQLSVLEDIKTIQRDILEATY